MLILEKWKKALDNKEAFRALLTDLLKAFDFVNHKFLIAKLHTYGLSLFSLKLVHDYLLKRKQITKANSKHSSWTKILEGVPQGSILGPLLFSPFHCDLYIIINTTYFSDDNMAYVI